MTRAAVLVLLCFAAAGSACGRGERIGEGGLPAPAKAAVPLAAASDLAALLPQLDGWQRGEVTSGGVNVPAPAVNARATYVRGGARLDLDLADTGGAPEHVDATLRLAGSETTQTAANGYMRGTTIGGHPAIESWNHVDRIAELTIIVDKRFVVYATATGLDGIDALRPAVDRVDLAALGRLRK